MCEIFVVIPARLQASRLPGKPLKHIAGEEMIVHVWRRACEADVGPVVVATDSLEIADVVEAAGGRAMITADHHLSGTDRVHEVVSRSDTQKKFDVIVNLQGDLPMLEPGLVAACARPLKESDADIATLAAEISDVEEREDPHVVKVVGTPTASPDILRALYFTRASAPTGEGPFYHHIGLYAFRRGALENFVALPPSALEKRERLEQLRALEAGMRIDVGLVDTVPLGVDTPADLQRARAMMEGKG